MTHNITLRVTQCADPEYLIIFFLGRRGLLIYLEYV